MRIGVGDRFALGIVIVVLSACGLVGSGATDEELVDATLAEWRDAMVAGDVDRVMATYSTDFACFDAPDREAMRALMAGMKEQGALDGVAVFLDRAEKAWDGDEVRVFPIDAAGPRMYFAAFRLTLRSEDGAWLISNQEW